MRNRSAQPKLRLWGLIVIATTLVAIFFPILNYDWIPIEDPSYYHLNPLFGEAPLLRRLLAAWFHAPESNYIPLTWNLTTLLAEFTEDNPRAFHSFSLLLHLLNSFLAFFLLRRLGLDHWATTLTVLLFALHPLRAESVAWASSIKGLLAAFFALGALLIQLYPQLKYRATFIVCLFALSLLSKQTLLLLPLVFALIATSLPEYQLKRSTYILLGLFTILAAVAASQANADNPLLAINRFYSGPLDPLKALAAHGHYLKTQLLPLSLIPEYPVNRHWSLIALGLLGLIPATFLTKAIIFSKKASLPLVLFMSFFALLLPTLGLITSPLRFAADRLSYLPSLFFWAAFVFLLSELTPPRMLGRFRLFTLLIILIPCAILTTRQLGYWKDDHLLTQHILREQPDHYLANLHIANLLGVKGKFTEALPYTQTLIQKHPHRFGGWKTFSEINIHLGSPKSSLESLEQALANPTPIRADLYLLRCQPLRTLGRFEEALESAQLARSHGTDEPTFHHQNAIIYYSANEIQQALQEIQKGLTHSPKSPTLLSLKSKIEASIR